jgi:Na+/H+-dicarboxylate symporter
MKMSLNTQIFLGAFLGLIFGIILGHSGLAAVNTQPFLSTLDLVGRIFIGLLQLIMFPLIFTAISTGIGNLKNAPQAGRIWPVLILYSLSTTALAAATGLLVMNAVKAGAGLDVTLFKESMNSFQARTPAFHDITRHLMNTHNTLTLVVLAAATGIVLAVLGDKSRQALSAINRLFDIMMKITRAIMHLAPLGIMGLLAKLTAQANINVLYVLSKYIFVVVATTLFHGAFTLPFILWLITRIPPQKFFSAMKEAFITAFSTSSSTATLPVSLRCITENLNVDTAIARFVLPVGSILNMDGTAMYEAMAALFVANLYGAHLALAAQLTVMLTAMLVSIGAPGIPSAGMVTMIMVLQSVGLPVQAVAILIAIDRPLDTIRTVVNVEGDCVGACVVQKAVLNP